MGFNAISFGVPQGSIKRASALAEHLSLLSIFFFFFLKSRDFKRTSQRFIPYHYSSSSKQQPKQQQHAFQRAHLCFAALWSFRSVLQSPLSLSSPTTSIITTDSTFTAALLSSARDVKGDLECIPVSVDVCSGEGCVHCPPPGTLEGDLECIPVDVCSGEGCVHCPPPAEEVGKRDVDEGKNSSRIENGIGRD